MLRSIYLIIAKGLFLIILFGTYSPVKAQAPIAGIDVNDSIVCIGNSVSFTDISIPGGSAITAWNWSFGDGGTSTAQNPSYVYTIGGNYTVTLVITDVLGNSDTATKIIYVLVAQAISNTVRICSPQSSVSIAAIDPGINGVNGTWFTASGAVIASPNNDTTVISNLISGTYLIFWVVSDGVCSDADQVTIIVDQPVSVNAGPDQQICTTPGTATMAASNPAPGTGLWTTTSSAIIANTSNRNTTVSGMNTPGTYTFVWTVTNGACVNRDTVAVIVSSPIAANAGADQQICSAPGTAILSANSPVPGTGLWTTTSSATINNPVNAAATVSGLTAAGTYTFIWSITNGACVTRDTMRIVVTVPVNANAGNNLQVCTVTAQATLSGNSPSPGTGLWTALNGGVITSPSSSVTTVTGLSVAGFYSFVWTITNGPCVSRDTMVIIVRDPVIANAGSDQQLCNTFNAVLTGNNPAPGTGLWTSSGTAIIATPSSATTTVSGLVTGSNTFIYTTTYGACVSRDTVIIRVDSLINANAGPDIAICETQTVVTMAANSPSPGSGTWTRLNGGTITSPANPATTISALTPGTHLFVWTVTNGSCISRDTMRIVVSVQIPSNAGLDQQVCQGATITLSGNNPIPASGLWTTGSGAVIASPSNPSTTASGLLSAGIYTFVWTVTNGACVLRDTVRITVDSSVSAIAGPDQNICNLSIATLTGNNPVPGNGTWTSTGSAGIASPSSSTTAVSNLVYGNNVFIWTVTNGSCVNRDTVVIRRDSSIVSNAGPDQNICSNVGNTLLAANAASPGTGQWSTLSSAVIANPSNPASAVSGMNTAGTYAFVWTITNGTCVSRDTVLITVSQTVIANAGTDQQACNVNTIMLAANNPAPGTGSWTTTSSATILQPNNPASQVSGLSVGVHTFIWTINNGACSTSDTVQVIIDSLIAALAGPDQQVCEGSLITMSANAPVSGSGVWTALNGGVISSPSSATTGISGLNTAGSYSFIWTISNNSCISEDTVLITVDEQVIANAGSDQQLCDAVSAVLAANSPLPGTGNWSASPPLVFLNPGSESTSVTGLTTGVYDIIWTVTNGSCSSSDTLQLQIDSTETAIAGADQLICSGDPVVLSANAPLAGAGIWTAGNGGVLADPVDPNTLVNGLLTAGNYNFIWTIVNGVCISSDTLVIIVDSVIPALAGADQQLCETQTSATLASNNAAPGTGTWSSSSAAVITNINDPNSSVSGLVPGNYDFIWTVENGNCTSSDTVSIVVSALPTAANAGTDQQQCANTVITLNANVPLTGTGSWSSLGSAVVDNPASEISTVSALVPGNNTFVWTITNGACNSSDTVSIFINPVPQADAGLDQFVLSGTNVTLGGMPAASGGTGPYTYQWYPGTGLSDSTASNPGIVVTVTSTFILLVNDSLGCTDTDTVTIWVNNPPDAQNDTVTGAEDSVLTVDVLLNDQDPDNNLDPASVVILQGPFNGTVTIGAGGQVVYTPGPNFYGVDSVLYIVCDSGLPVYCDSAWLYITVMPVNDAPLANDDYGTTPEDSCIQIAILSNDSDFENMLNQATLLILSGPSNGTFNLDTLTGILTYCPDSDFTGIDTLIYVICDSGYPQPFLCDTALVIITVTPDNDPPVAVNDSIVICSGDPALVPVLLNDFDPEGDTLSVSILIQPVSGTALITASQEIVYTSTTGISGWDSLQYVICDQQIPAACDTAWLLVYIHPLPQAVSMSTDILCYGDSTGSIDVTVLSPGTSSYAWSNGAVTEDISNLVAGVYTVSIMDTNACVLTITDTVSGPLLPLTAFVTVQHVLCYGDTNGVVDITVSGGTSPYIFSWDNGSTEEDIDSLTAGTYSVFITDSNACSVSVSATVTAPALPLTALLTTTDILCSGDSTGSLSVMVGGGTPGYQYSWSNGSTSAVLTDLLAGIYTVMVSDSNACTLMLSDTISDISTPIILSAVVTDPNCLNGIQGAIQTTVSGGYSPYNFVWSTGDLSTGIDSLGGGIYLLTVTDSLGCMVTASYTLQDTSSITINISGTPQLCSGDSVVLSVNQYAGISYQWLLNGTVLTGDTAHQLTVNAAGDYEVTATTLCGVFSDGPVTVTVHPLPVIDAGSDAFIHCDSLLTLSAVGAMNYHWSPASLCTTPDQAVTGISALITTAFVVNGTDVNGCSSSDTVLVTVSCDTISIPNGFSPNGDNFNDYFVIDNIGRYPEANLKIFNRWGQLVYEKERYDNSWNGLSNSDLIRLGEDLPDGTYFYILDLGNGDKPLNGFVVLRR